MDRYATIRWLLARLAILSYGNYTSRMRRGGLGCLTQLFLVSVLGVALVYGVVVVTAPWAFHIGGRWTPLIIWRGTGKLLTKDGIEYPIYLYFYPSSHFSQLRRESLRPTGGLQGYGWLCTSPGVTQRLELSGTIYGGWRSTEGSLMAFRLLEQKIFDIGQGGVSSTLPAHGAGRNC